MREVRPWGISQFGGAFVSAIGPIGLIRPVGPMALTKAPPDSTCRPSSLPLRPRQHLPQPTAVLVLDSRGRLLLVVDLCRKAALIVAAGEGHRQVDARLAFIGGQGQFKTRQLFLQRRRVNLVALRLRGAR